MLAATALAVTLATFGLVLEAGQVQLRQASRQRLVIGEAVLRAVLERYQYLPSVLALDTEVRALLEDAEAPPRIAAVNGKFEAVARAAGAAAVYLLDRDGLTRAASNWNQGDLSYVGTSYAYRPYFRDALAQGASRYFGIGTTTGRPGLFIGKAVPAHEAGVAGGVAGVVVVKVDLEGLQGEWRQAGEHVLVSDAAGVVFLASDPAWKYRPLRPLTEAEAARIRAARQYGESDPRPLLAEGAAEDTIRLVAGGRSLSGIAERAAMPDLGWTLWYVAETGPALRQALLAGLAAGIACLALIFALAAASQRRRRLRSERTMRLTLERRVAERTRDLSAVNARLRAEITERERATAALRATQDELIHAGRLAALGQISTAINHEINQPLAALRTFLASSAIFLERGETGTVRRNLQRMTEVTQRIAEIIRHLKGFARKTGPEHWEAVRLDASRRGRPRPARRPHPRGGRGGRPRDPGRGPGAGRAGPPGAGDPEPSGQRPRRDAGGARAPARFDRVPRTGFLLAAQRRRQRRRDPGGAHAARVRPVLHHEGRAGEGLGLGLSLSAMIVRDFGGSLSAGNGARGAVLALVLLAAEA